jgi:uncharacterized RDD family membrane protein YckC
LNGWGADAAVCAVTIGVMLAWFAGWQAAAGATPAMLFLGLRVRGPGGEDKPSLVAAVIRNTIPITAAVIGAIAADDDTGAVLTLASFLVYVAIGVTISRSPTHQGFHDRLASGTYVVRPAPAPSTTL